MLRLRHRLLIAALCTGCLRQPTTPVQDGGGAGVEANTPTAPATDPADSAATQEAAAAAYQAQDWSQCAAQFSELADASESSSPSYNAACCLALNGQVAEALAELKRTATRGYRDLAHLRTDSDLQALRRDPQWATIEAAVSTNEAAYLATINVELQTIYTADQADRQAGAEAIDWSVVSQRDAERRTRTQQIVDAGEAKAADDYYHAAMVFQHGDKPDDFQQAHRWALHASELDPSHARARWLAAASMDRYLMNTEQPQRYGTQFVTRDGQWVLYEVDPEVTDEERARFNVPPLAAAQARATAMNAAR